MIKFNYFFKFLTLSSIFLAGCFGGEGEDLNLWMNNKKMEVKPYIIPIKEPFVFSPQSYTENQSLDPFNLLKLTSILMRDSDKLNKNLALLAAERNRRKEELESYPLDNVAMVGSIKKDGVDVALLRVNNLIYQVKISNYVGQNYGKIVKIEENRVDLREIVQEGTGEWVERMTSLDLQEKE